MKVSEQSTVPPRAGEEAVPQTLADNIAAREKVSLSAMVARSFVKFDVALRARLLGRLLASVGPLALKVVGGGVFAKYVRHARSPEIPVSFEDAARYFDPGARLGALRRAEQSEPCRRTINSAIAKGWRELRRSATSGSSTTSAQSDQPSTVYAVIRCRRKYDSTLWPRLAPVPRASTTYPLFPTSDGILWALGQLQDCYRTMFEPACRSYRGEGPPTRSTARS